MVRVDSIRDFGGIWKNYRIQWSLIAMYVLYKSTSTFIWVVGVVTSEQSCGKSCGSDTLETKQ